jgi:hypothetical protein
MKKMITRLVSSLLAVDGSSSKVCRDEKKAQRTLFRQRPG